MPALTANLVEFDNIYTQKEDLTKMIKVEYEEERINARINKTDSYNPSSDVIYNQDFPKEKKPKFQTIIDNQSCNNKCLDNIILFRDSFGSELIKFLLFNTKRLNVIHSQKVDINYIIDQKPNLVIFEIVERNVEVLFSLK